MPTKAEHLQSLFHEYQREHKGIPETPYRVVEWAMKKGLLEQPKIDPKAILAEQMAAALREEYATDPATGKRYRRNHAARITKNSLQFTLWAEMDTAPRDHMVKAFQQRRRGVVGDCIQLKTDVDVYNGKHKDMEQIPLVLDFTDDVAEAEAAEDDADDAA